MHSRLHAHSLHGAVLHIAATHLGEGGNAAERERAGDETDCEFHFHLVSPKRFVRARV
jgi:hypothetical protein